MCCIYHVWIVSCVWYPIRYKSTPTSTHLHIIYMKSCNYCILYMTHYIWYILYIGEYMCIYIYTNMICYMSCRKSCMLHSIYYTLPMHHIHYMVFFFWYIYIYIYIYWAHIVYSIVCIIHTMYYALYIIYHRFYIIWCTPYTIRYMHYNVKYTKHILGEACYIFYIM